MNKLDSVSLMPTRIRIAATLRKAILSGELKEGQELALTQIANELEVSRTPVREAFQMLASEDLLELRMNRGAIVKGIQINTILEHFDMRKLLEGEAAARAAINHMDIEDLLNYQDEISNLKGNFSSEQYRVYNQAIHTSIWKAANNQKLFSMITSLWNGSSFGKTMSPHEHYFLSIQEHGILLHYIQAKEPLLARREMEHHIERSMQNIIDSYQTSSI